MLGRFTFDDYEMGIPPLHQTMGIPAPIVREQTPEEMERVLRMWEAATGSRSIN